MAYRCDCNANEWPIDAIAVALKLSNELSRWPALNVANLHPYRLKVKVLLYVLQLENEADEGLVKTLAAVKDAIGEWHDWQHLAVIAGKMLHHGSRCNLLKQIRAKVREKFEHALASANKMRKQYLEGSASELCGGSDKKAVARLNLPLVLATTSLAA